MASEPKKLILPPGILSEESQLAAKGRWWSSNLVRFRQGMPEKMGGWIRFGTQDVVGVPRSMLSYFFLSGDAATAIGTSQRLMMSKGGLMYDLTPVQKVVSTTNGFTTTAGSQFISITFGSAHGASVGDWILVPSFTIGGIGIGGGTDGYGAYQVSSIASSTVLFFDAGIPAVSSAGPAGGVRLVTFLYPIGSVGAVAGLGWGAGAYSRAGWGTAAPTTNVASALRYWSLAQWGERLLTTPNGGPLFAFIPSASGAINSRAALVVNSSDGKVARIDVTAGGSGYVSTPTVTISAPPVGGTTATAIVNMAGTEVASIDITSPGSGYLAAPTVSFSGGGGGSGAAAVAVLEPIRSPSLVNNYVLVGNTERHAIILGSGDLGKATGYDPMLVRWSDLDDYSDWWPDGLNSAGQRRAQEGSRLVAGCNLSLLALLWSDTALHQMRFTGAPYWYSIEVVGRNCGLVGPGAFVEMGGAVFWMGRDSFWMWRGGAPIQIPCSMQSLVFNNLNRSQASRIACGGNVSANEVIWFYPSADSDTGENDRYIILCLADMSFYGGAMARTAWIDAGAVSRPLGAHPSGRIYQQETGTDADGEAMNERLESGYIDQADGDPFTHVERLVPDWARLAGGLRVYVSIADYPGGPVRVRGPFTVTAGTKYVGSRGRGRALAVTIEGDGVGGDWRLGALRAMVSSVGSR